MADVSHLERMGRELKCPICLSLLNSAVSLTCNHAFCNSCIEKSMKSASDCPVCKVPFRRREIRPAPHMDNLVSVYKSMEAASGVNIFVTQNAAPTKVSGEDYPKDVNICKSQDNGEAQLQVLDCKNRKKCPRKGSQKASMANQLKSVKPSFPTKKRVQVPQSQCPTSGTHLQPENLGGGIEESKALVSSVMQKDATSLSEKGEPVLSPFFWLREQEDLEKSSQQTDGDQEMYTPLETPCFSDIKDSDDGTPNKKCPEREDHMLPNAADFIDSEMFDWTQRPCSPELCSTPLAVQVEDIAGKIEAPEKAEAASTETTTCPLISSCERRGVGKKKASRKSGKKCEMEVSNKRASDATETKQKKRVKKNICEVTAVHIESAKMSEQDMQEKSGSTEKILNLRGKNRNNKMVLSEAIISQIEAEISDGTDLLGKSNGPPSVDFAAPKNGWKTSERSGKLKKSVITSEKSGMLKKSVKTSASNQMKNCQQQKLGGKVKAGKLKTGNDHINEKQPNEVLIAHSNSHLLSLGHDEEASERKTTRKVYERKSEKMPKSTKKVKFSVEITSNGNDKSLPRSADDEAAVSGKKIQENHGSIDQSVVKVPATLGEASPCNGSVLLKCKTLMSTINCAFCQSSEESEASGTMIHYLNGKPVSESDDAVHVHRHCTEWAPNVYFEDDTVVNLENELARSRRIRCSCCGKKGAALGCYEKSCRKSYHVPCAQLTPECRWDYENFVMLCPAHASCQLPSESTKSKPQQKRRLCNGSKSHENQPKATDGCRGSSSMQWKSQKKFRNLVLCCSALTNIEKEIVSKFEKLPGVAILKNWDSSVTHVIASTDENGACRRTLKFLMGILEGKWILRAEWLKACMEAGELVDEQLYEISVDIHGIRDGPRLGRLRLPNKQPKLFDGYYFFFMGDFAPSYKGYLHDLVTTAGGKVLNRKPVVGEQATSTFIVYSVELDDKCKPSRATSILERRQDDALVVADSSGSIAVSNSWIMNSIAGYKFQSL